MLQVVPRLDQGGVERGTLEIVAAIRAAGGRALVATSGGRLSAEVAGHGGVLVPMPLATKAPWKIWRNAAALAALVRAEGVDVIHARSRAPGWSAWVAARRTGVAFVTTYHGAYGEDLPLKRLYNSVMARGRPVIAVSDFIRDLVIARHRLAPERVVTIPRGADLAVFSPEAVSPARVARLRVGWGLADDPRPIVMLPGRLTRWKGQLVAVEAAAALLAEGSPGFVLLLVGDAGAGGYAAEIDGRIAALGLSDVVRRTGGCADMAAAYAASAIVISASTQPEAFGRVAIEAQAMARPVIATDHGGARETVAPGQTGWLTAPGDPGALADALGAALGLGPQGRARMGALGRSRVRARFTLAAMQAATLAVYEGASGRRFGGAGGEGLGGQ